MQRISKTLLKTRPLYFPRLQGQATYARPLYTIAKQRQPSDISGGKNSAPQLKSHRAAFCSRASKHSFLSFQQSWSRSAVKILGTDMSENIVDVTWEDGNKNQYPLIYLRDICQCPSCVHPGRFYTTYLWCVANLWSGLQLYCSKCFTGWKSFGDNLVRQPC